MRPLYHAKADRLRREGAGRSSGRGVQKLADAEGAEPRGIRAVPAGRRPPADGPGRRGRRRTRRRASRHTDRFPTRTSSAPSSPSCGRTPSTTATCRPIDGRHRQRHVGDGDGGAHRLQHGLRLDAAEQPASVSLDELALPGRRHGRLADGRELHRRSRPPIRDSGAAGRRADEPRDRMSSTRARYYEYTHFSDALMTDQEILELPKVWVVGGDGGMGDIGYQNTSKVVLQNRPNVKALMLDTQVYSNTGGQNSDSTPMLGGNDMNVFGAATPGQEHREEDRRRDVPGGPRVALHRAGLDRERPEAVPRDPRRPGVPGDDVHAVLHDVPARARRGRRHGPRPGAARAGLARRARVRLQPAGSARPTRRRSTSRATRRWTWTGTRPSSRGPANRTGLPSPTGAPPRRGSGTTSRRSSKEDADKLIPLDEHAGSHHPAGRRLSPPSESRSPVVRARLRGVHQGAGRPGTSSTDRCRASSCSSAWSAARRGGCCRARRESRTARYRAQRSILADLDAGRISREDLFARAGELVEERLPKPASAHKAAEPKAAAQQPVPARAPAAPLTTPAPGDAAGA